MLLVSPESLLPSTFSSYMLPVSSCRSRDCKIVGSCPVNVRDPERTIVGEGTIDEPVEGISDCKLPLPALVLPSLPDLPFSLSRNLSLGRLKQDEKPRKPHEAIYNAILKTNNDKYFRKNKTEEDVIVAKRSIEKDSNF